MGKYQFSSLGKEGRVKSHQVEEAEALESIGIAAVGFVAKIDRDGEVYCWIEGRDKKWFASLVRKVIAALPPEKETSKSSPHFAIEQAYRAEMARRGEKLPGWESVLDVLEFDDINPVVISYSVSGCFPSAEFAPADWHPEITGDKRYDTFDKLKSAEQWELAMPELRRRHPERRIVPQAEVLATFLYEAIIQGLDPHDLFRGALIDIAMDAPDRAGQEAAFAHLSETDQHTFAHVLQD
jgi:hypothetical protein